MENQTDNRDQEQRKLDKSTLPWVILGLIIISIAIFNLLPFYLKKKEQTPEIVYANVPDFSLTNQQGQPLGLSDLQGKIWVADFIFTHCPTICPVMTQEMVKLQSEFDSEPVYFVSFTVDPERDTPEVLSRYAGQYGADEQQWHFLTGEKDQIYQLANEGFKLSAAQHGGGFPHSARFVLVAPNGTIHDYYDSRSKPAMKRLRKDVKTLLKK
ncbi:MAG: SCO family protein [Candidatus Poribacteria bacterium]|nr:SCO family protein [Candidatus Poribacteria bacterium]